MKLAQLVLGPAGVGKSTYCEAMADHCKTIGRPLNVINLDPAAEEFFYPVSSDIRDLISLSDVAEELNLGPNGGLVYCMEYFESNLREWMDEELEGYTDDDYVLLDCPGQSEINSNLTVFNTLIDYLQNDGWTVCAVYCLDSHFMTDASKFVGGCFQALSAVINLEIPHLNILTKMDLCKDKEELDAYLQFDKHQLLSSLSQKTSPKFEKLNNSVADLVEEFNLISFLPLDITDTDNIHEVLLSMDQATQYGEDRDFKTRDFDFM